MHGDRLLSKKVWDGEMFCDRIKGSCVNGGDEGFCSVLDVQDLWDNLLHLALWYLLRLLLTYSLCPLLLSSAFSGISLVPHTSIAVLHDVWHPYHWQVALARGKLISSRVMINSTNPAAL